MISTRRAAAEAAASANTTPVSASPRTAAEDDSATSAPELRDVGGGLRHLRRSLAGRGQRRRPLLGRPRLEHGRVGGQLPVGQPERAPAEVGRPLRGLVGGGDARGHLDQRGGERSPHRGGASAAGRGRGLRDRSQELLERLFAELGHRELGYLDKLVQDAADRLIEDATGEQVERFRRDGFLIIEEGLVPMAAVEVLRERFAAIFEGDYATGIAPDEVNWKKGRDRDDVTRQICNGWRADDLIAAQVLSEKTGRIAARLGGYRGTRMLQDNCLWKPPGTKSLGMHQDGSYAGYLSPPEMITCWVALDETFAQGGTIEYVRGSHLWPKAPPDRGSFHAPDDWLAPLANAAPEGVEIERVPVVVKPGGCAFHHSLTFHGSGPNESRSSGGRWSPTSSRSRPASTRQHGPHLLALPPPRRPLARRVVLPRAVGRERRQVGLAAELPPAIASRLTCDHLVTYYPGHGRRVQGPRRPHAPQPARRALQGGRADADSAGGSAPDVALRRDEAPEGARGGEPRGHQAARAREAPLPEPRPDPARPRQVGEQVRRALGGDAHRASRGTLEDRTMEKVFEIYIKTTPERLWDAITDPEMRAKYSFGVETNSDWTNGSGYTAPCRG